ncbi:MAG TPA: hypothetical protein PLE54_12585 [Burkholderiaceae bacterium]|nr:hypothetical protein [Burkholderiaceae bacterium]HQR71437.1 hypothetical protein [Burkholderiaceae bacterium]
MKRHLGMRPTLLFRLWCRTTLLAALVGAASCTAQAAELRGFASPGPMGVILFQACQGKALVPAVTQIEDATPESALSAGLNAVAQIMLERGRPIYVEFSGTPSGKGVKATRFSRAMGTLASCEAASTELSAGARLWAGGQEPPWQLVVTAREARFERPAEKPVRFPAGPFAAAAGPGPRTIDAWSQLDGGTVRLELDEAMCTDGRSETAYGARATLRYGSRTYEGCAARF